MLKEFGEVRMQPSDRFTLYRGGVAAASRYSYFTAAIQVLGLTATAAATYRSVDRRNS